MQFLCNFGKSWWLRFSKTFNKEQIGCQEGFFEEINEVFFEKNAQFATKNDNSFEMYRFFTFSCNFCKISKDFMDQNGKYFQPRLIWLSNRVVSGDKCSFVKKILPHGPQNNQKALLFFTFLYFTTQFL